MKISNIQNPQSPQKRLVMKRYYKILQVLLQCIALVAFTLHARAQSNIVKAEYYLDTDPGFGSGTNIPITAGTDISAQAFSVDISGLTNGIHYLHARAIDAKGIWSLNNTAIFYKGNTLGGGSPPPVVNIVQAEYYLDADPGFGNATAIAITPGTDISAQAFSVDISGLTNGIHYLHSRARDANGHWSLNNTAIFYKGNPLGGGSPPPPGNLVKLEYFFDKDPGFGNGTPVSIPGNKTDTVGFIFNADLHGVSKGKHAFYVRAMDDWGLTNVDSFTLSVALPVSLVNFTGQLVKDQVQLNWQTASEFNNDHFEIDHSADGIHFSSIGNVKGNGTTAIPHDYKFLDANPANGNNYYRLKQVDLDGNYTFSPVVNVKLVTGFTYMVYPNPAKNKVNIVISSDKDQLMVFILCETSGKIIETKELKCVSGNNKFEWDISRLAKGMYMIRSQNSQASVVKIVKE